LGKTVLRTYRGKADIDDVYPNDRQPRLGAKEDEELQRQIENERRLV
jgi:ParB family transcriptional regulator, chromosome partitioning protein